MGEGCIPQGNVCFYMCMLREVNKSQLDSAVSKSRGCNLSLLLLVEQTVGGMGVKLKYLIALSRMYMPPVGFLLSDLWMPRVP